MRSAIRTALRATLRYGFLLAVTPAALPAPIRIVSIVNQAPAGKVAARVVSDTGTPLAFFWIEQETPRPFRNPVAVCSDAMGVIDLEPLQGAGGGGIRLLDSPRDALLGIFSKLGLESDPVKGAVVAKPAGDGSHDVTVSLIGTWDLVFEQRGPSDDATGALWFAALGTKERGFVSSQTLVEEDDDPAPGGSPVTAFAASYVSDIRSAAARGTIGFAIAPIRRDGGHDWVRFSGGLSKSILKDFAVDGFWLRVRSTDGYSSAECGRVEIGGSGSLAVVIEDRGVLRWKRVRTKGSAAPGAITLESVPKAGEPSFSVAIPETGREGVIRWLPPGEYDLARGRGSKGATHRRVTIAPRSTSEVDLVELNGVGDESATSKITIEAKDEASSDSVVTARCVRVDDPEASCSFRLVHNGSGVHQGVVTGLAEGEYELSVTDEKHRTWEPDTLRLAAGAKAEFRARSAATVSLSFSLVDAASGSPLDAASIQLFWREATNSGRQFSRGNGVFLNVPSTHLIWVARKNGYQAQMGRIDDASLLPEGGKVVVSLRPGFGEFVRVDTADELGIPDVEIVADSKSVGRTDADGLFHLTLPARPETLRAVREGWRCTWASGVDLESGSIQDTIAWFLVFRMTKLAN